MMKDLLVVIDNSTNADALVKTAVALAERVQAHAEVAMLSPGPLASAKLAPFGALYVSDEVLLKEEKARLAQVRALVADASAPIEVYGLRDDVAWITHDLRLSHPVADLILVGGPESWALPWLRQRVLETLLLTTGTPLLVMPAGHSPAPVRHAVLGWKPSREANRTVHDLVGLAEPGATIELVIVDDDAEAGRRADVVEVQRHLSRHDFRTSMHVVRRGDRPSIGDVLLHHAVTQQADLLAAGGYAHSRVREAVLGGVTRTLLGDVPLPVLLSH